LRDGVAFHLLDRSPVEITQKEHAIDLAVPAVRRADDALAHPAFLIGFLEQERCPEKLLVRLVIDFLHEAPRLLVVGEDTELVERLFIDALAACAKM